VQTTRFEPLLPAYAVVAEAEPWMWERGLWKVETEQASKFVPKRLQEFAAGRNCVRQALQMMGRPAVAIPIGKQRIDAMDASLLKG